MLKVSFLWASTLASYYSEFCLHLSIGLDLIDSNPVNLTLGHGIGSDILSEVWRLVPVSLPCILVQVPEPSVWILVTLLWVLTLVWVLGLSHAIDPSSLGHNLGLSLFRPLFRSHYWFGVLVQLLELWVLVPFPPLYGLGPIPLGLNSALGFSTLMFFLVTLTLVLVFVPLFWVLVFVS